MRKCFPILILLMLVQIASAQVILYADTVAATPGDTVELPVRVANWQGINYMQGTAEWNPAKLQFVSVGQFNLVALGPANFGQNNTAGGKLTWSWNEPNVQGTYLPDGAMVFAVRFVVLANTNGVLPVNFVDDPTEIEFGDTTFTIVSHVAQPGGVEVSGGVGRLEAVNSQFGIYPNPIYQGQFQLSAPGEGTLNWSVYDLQGRLLQSGVRDIDGPVQFDTEGFREAGIYLFKWNLAGQSDTQRIVIK